MHMENDGLIWLLMAVFSATFLLAAVLTGRRLPGQVPGAVREGASHFLALWLPLIASLFVLYFFVIADNFSDINLFPANATELATFSPRWLAVILYLVALAELLNLGRGLEAVLFDRLGHPNFLEVKTLALFMVGLCCLYFLLVEPLVIVLMLPTASWIFITGREGWGKVLDVALFFFGGVMFALFVWYAATVSPGSGAAIVWYLLMATAVRSVSTATAFVATVVMAAGLSLVVKLPAGERGGVNG